MNIIPSYNCNFNCPFCVVHSKADQTLLDLDWFRSELKRMEHIDHLNIIGGEPTQLDEKYLEELIDICTAKLGRKPSLYTNLSRISPLFKKVELNVSFNPGITQSAGEVKKNLLLLDQPFNINMILTNKLAEGGIDKLKSFLRLGNLKQLSVSRYTNFGGPDFTPTKEQYLNFTKGLTSLALKDSRIHFYPISSQISQRTRDNTALACAEVLPNNKYRISIRDFYRDLGDTVFNEYDTWEELSHAYAQLNTKRIWSRASCNDCRFNQACLCLFKDRTDCEAMEQIEKQIREAQQ